MEKFDDVVVGVGLIVICWVVLVEELIWDRVEVSLF